MIISIKADVFLVHVNIKPRRNDITMTPKKQLLPLINLGRVIRPSPNSVQYLYIELNSDLQASLSTFCTAQSKKSVISIIEGWVGTSGPLRCINLILMGIVVL